MLKKGYAPSVILTVFDNQWDQKKAKLDGRWEWIFEAINKVLIYVLFGWAFGRIFMQLRRWIVIFLGILGEYIYRNYKESQNRPVYFVRTVYDGSPDK